MRTGDTMAINATLEVGAVSESIEVTAAVPLLETETSATGQVVSGDYQYALPLYQRNVKAIMYLVPGMTMNGFGYAGQMNNFHINGLRSGYIGYFEDGALATGTDNNGLTSDTILNAVEEVKVITSALPAEYGHSAGGAITVVKKTGTNEFHGMLSMLGRTRRMQHRKYFDRETPTQRGDMIVFAQPDANISGPVYIPKIYDGRNRTFFMLAWQKLIDKQAKQNQYTVPTEEMKQGDFRFGGIGQPIYDPRTTRQLSDGTWVRDPFPDNIIPKSQFDPVAAKILSYDPFTHPNQPGSMSTTGPTQNLALAPVTAVLWPNWSIRTDHQFSPSLKSYFSYTWNERDYWTKPTTIKYLPFSSSEAREPIHMHTVSLGTTWVLSPTLVSETRAGYYRRRQGWEVPTYMKNMAAEIGLPNLAPDHFPLGFYGSLGQGTPTVDVNETLSFKQDVSKVSGSHAFKWGYELMRYRINSY
ncbi:MAG TPA: TonB-dependent receptor plug domain-containing protein, partial [Bryobacteraceae bacterium]|nr:TonB-dependent receptor plug domain-containing protein [Bryobacteraceae bacterium]HPU74267.1 TonB-dependent receptor plug domain-containing protein [Bryobacteraceae bacterium]